MKRIGAFLIILLFCGNVYSLSYNIKGDNIIWSPVSEELLLYSVYGKASGTRIWKIFNIKNKKSDTMFYGNSLLPQWSLDGKSIVFTKKNVIQLFTDNKKVKEYTTSVVDLTDYNWGVKGDRLTYSNGEKIYILEIGKNNNYFVANGESPSFIDNDRKILYFDKDLKVNIIDETLKSRVLIDNMVKKVIPLKLKNGFLFHEENNIKFYDLLNNKSYIIVNDKNQILDFYISYDNEFLTYNNSKGEHFAVHILTHLKMQVKSDKKYFAHKLSYKNKFSCFEKSGEADIISADTYIDAFNINSIYKVSFGSIDNVKKGDTLEVYQEKKNPFTERLIGYDENGFKGSVRIISVYEDYCFVMIDKELSNNKKIEIGDAVLYKGKDKLGSILKK